MTPLSEARRQAEGALAAYDRCKGYEAYTYAFDCVRPLRALLAALLAEPAPPMDDDIEHPCGCYAPDGNRCWRHAAPATPDAVREAAERLDPALPEEPAHDAVWGDAEIACPETLSTERRCGACPTCRCLAQVERLQKAIEAHKHEFERMKLRPDPCDYDLWAALDARKPDAVREAAEEVRLYSPGHTEFAVAVARLLAALDGRKP